MISALHSALSGLTAFAKSVAVTAHNVANVATSEFKRSRTEFREAADGGVRTSVAVDGKPGSRIQQDAARGSALVEQSNVDPGEEMVNLLAARREFSLNVSVVKTTDEMLGTLVNLRK